MADTLIGVDVGSESSTALFELGTRYYDPNNDKEYVYSQAGEALAATDALVISEAAAAVQADTTSTASAFGDRMGVSNIAVTNAYYFWAQIYGATTLNVATSCAANTAINSTATGGRLDDDATSGAEVASGIVTTGAESGNAAAAFMNYPTVGATL